MCSRSLHPEPFLRFLSGPSLRRTRNLAKINCFAVVILCLSLSPVWHWVGVFVGLQVPGGQLGSPADLRLERWRRRRRIAFFLLALVVLDERLAARAALVRTLGGCDCDKKHFLTWVGWRQKIKTDAQSSKSNFMFAARGITEDERLVMYLIWLVFSSTASCLRPWSLTRSRSGSRRCHSSRRHLRRRLSSNPKPKTHVNKISLTYKVDARVQKTKNKNHCNSFICSIIRTAVNLNVNFVEIWMH